MLRQGPNSLWADQRRRGRGYRAAAVGTNRIPTDRGGGGRSRFAEAKSIRAAKIETVAKSERHKELGVTGLQARLHAVCPLGADLGFERQIRTEVVVDLRGRHDS